MKSELNKDEVRTDEVALRCFVARVRSRVAWHRKFKRALKGETSFTPPIVAAAIIEINQRENWNESEPTPTGRPTTTTTTTTTTPTHRGKNRSRQINHLSTFRSVWEKIFPIFFIWASFWFSFSHCLAKCGSGTWTHDRWVQPTSENIGSTFWFGANISQNKNVTKTKM